MATLAFPSPSGADVSAVSGGAFGYSTSVGLFNGAPTTRGPAPTVTLPSGGSAAPVVAEAPSGTAQYGPAAIFLSGPLRVSTEGTTGPNGKVTSSARIERATPDPFAADLMTSTCTASESGVSGSTTLTNGKLTTSQGGDLDDPADDTVVPIPSEPGVNASYEGKLEVVGDTFRWVFNEQIRNPDGSITVNAAHEYLLGPTAVGDLIIGQVRCAATAGGSAPASAGGASPSTTRAGSGVTVGSTAPNAIANTGTGILPLLLPAALLVAVGITVLVAGRRRVAEVERLPRGRP